MTARTEHVRMRDGVSLATDVRLPSGEGPWPATLMRTPYLRSNEFLPLQPAEDLQLAVVLQDVRGRFDSEGSFDMGRHDAEDGADTVGWIATQSWCDGRVAMHGISYAGHTQVQAARGRPPALACISPIRCPAWWGPLTMHEAGALCVSLAAHWLPGQAMEARACTSAQREALAAIALTFDQICDYPAGAPTAQCTLDMTRALQHPGLSRRPFRERPEFDGTPEFAAAWRSLFEQPFLESWVTDPGPAEDDGPACPTLILSGWYDCWAQDAVAMQQQLHRRGVPHRLVMTPNSHAPEPAGELNTGPDARRFDDWLAIRWTCEWLMDASREVRELAPVTYFLMNANSWHEADAWPPPGVSATRLFLHAVGARSDGTLRSAPADSSTSVSFLYDPRDPMPTLGGPALGLPPGPVEQSAWDAQHRQDVCSFATEVLVGHLDICGPVTATIHLSTDARDTDVVVKLLDVFPDGRTYNIVDGIVRARFRDGRSEHLLEGGVHAYRIHCWNIAYRVGAGHRIRLDVTSSSFPRYEPNANTGALLGSDRLEDLHVARQTVHTGDAHPSHVALAVTAASLAPLKQSLH